ncbi:Serine/threonine-protein phosphatase 2A 55 kDa regulatory subunit B gamma isoform [Tupaia chinensis]|uniref:Serine/threonine-protein phosphatase 2A 55 kDa regulatory subunit B n=2 Tax=Boreoeutheria TaxID=1437010 RepID=L9KIB8_TUPCH|nr:Serine/threonine-protein phosphatase 2A 55 kDa regulatory subunit B gamma isoform [Tupaia chinensis]
MKSKNAPHSQGEYDVYSTFQSHEPEFDYLKSLEIEEKINKIKWLPQQNAAHSLLSTNDKTIKLWKITERDKRPEGYNLKDEEGKLKDLSTVTSLQSAVACAHRVLLAATCPHVVLAALHQPCTQLAKPERPGYELPMCPVHCRPLGPPVLTEVSRSPADAIITPVMDKEAEVPVLKPMDLMVEVSPRRIFANGHTYHINSISVNSDCETYMSADDLRINLWHLAITDRSFNIVDIKPANMEDLTEVITASEFHPHHCNLFVYSSSKGSLRLCDMRAAALCDKHSKLFEEPEDPSNRSFFSEIISSVSDVKFSHSGRYMLTRDYLTVKVWDLNMEARPIETYQVHDYLRSKLCSLYENDCIFDKFECAWNGSDRVSEQVCVVAIEGLLEDAGLAPWRQDVVVCGLGRATGHPGRAGVRPRQATGHPGRAAVRSTGRVALAPGAQLAGLRGVGQVQLHWAGRQEEGSEQAATASSVIMTGAYNNFFRMFDRNTKRDVTLEASRESSKPRAVLKPRRVCVGGKRRRDDISVDSLDFTKKILHTAWHPAENIIAIAATNNLYIFQDKVNSDMH